MADYQLTSNNVVIRTADGARIPDDPANSDWVVYQEWLDAGGVPDPYEPPEPVPPVPTPQQEVLYEHENRIRALEGQAPLTIEDLLDKVTK